ncbi:protein NLRC3-like [Pimephales promelas]|nr:protein NLRC3-like [Pimephales promelas]
MADSQASRDGDFSPGHSSVQQKSSNPESSCVSVKSDWSMDKPIKFKSGDTRPNLSWCVVSVLAQYGCRRIIQVELHTGGG